MPAAAWFRCKASPRKLYLGAGGACVRFLSLNDCEESHEPGIGAFMNARGVDVNEWLVSLVNRCDRVVVTATKPFNAKDRSKNDVILNIQDPDEVLSLARLVEVNSTSVARSWMSPADIYFNFLFERQVIGAIGVVLRGFLRAAEWTGDYEIRSAEAFVRWCEEKGISNNPRW